MRKLAAVLGLIFSLTACWADDGPDDLRYDVVSYPWWQIVAFYDHPNSTSDAPDLSIGHSKNSGWDTVMGSYSSRNFRRLEENPNGVRINITWYEVATGRAYKAKIVVNASDLKRDYVRPEAGLLIFRIARAGEIQAVTYKPAEDVRDAEPIILAQVCGESINTIDPKMMAEIERIIKDPLVVDANRIPVAPSNVPSRCD